MKGLVKGRGETTWANVQLITSEELIWTVNFELDLPRSARLVFNGTGTFYQAIEK